MYKKETSFVYSDAELPRAQAQMSQVGRVAGGELASLLRRARPLTVLISQRNRGGLRAWGSQALRPDVVVDVTCGDDAAKAVRVCARGNQMYGWPVLCVVMGANHAYARIEAAAKAVHAPNVEVLVVEGR